jgi:hypothetical protein
MGLIVTIPLILLFILLSPKKVNKHPKFASFRQSPELKGNPKQIGQPLGISSTVKPNIKFKNHAEWWAYIRNERDALNS